MDTKEKTNRKNGKNRKNRKRNIENTERKWREKFPSITRNRVVLPIKNARIITTIMDTGTAPMTNIVTTGTMIIKGIDTTIRAIGGLGINGIYTQENIQAYTGMEDITVKRRI